MSDEQSVQERYAPSSICFGCGPANPDGLHVRSFVEGDGLVAEFTPQPHQQAFPGVLNGGIISTLLDCHANWTAAHHLMIRRGSHRPPTTVTAELAVKLLHPTPIAGPLSLRAWVVDSSDRRATVEAELVAEGVVTATARATFVAVSEGHPAFERW